MGTIRTRRSHHCRRRRRRHRKPNETNNRNNNRMEVGGGGRFNFFPSGSALSWRRPRVVNVVQVQNKSPNQQFISLRFAFLTRLNALAHTHTHKTYKHASESISNSSHLRDTEERARIQLIFV